MHQRSANGSNPPQARKWRYQIDPLAVQLYMPSRLPASCAIVVMGEPLAT